VQNQSNYSRDVLYWALVTLSNAINQAEKKIVPFKDHLGELFLKIIQANDETY
jgi:hypothetical protein